MGAEEVARRPVDACDQHADGSDYADDGVQGIEDGNARLLERLGLGRMEQQGSQDSDQKNALEQHNFRQRVFTRLQDMGIHVGSC